jgi:hypothetical protein
MINDGYVRELLQAHLLRLMKPSPNRDWARDLTDSDDLLRFAVCLLIDILSGALEAEVVASQLALLDPPQGDDVLTDLAKIADRIPELPPGSQEAATRLTERHSYVRVLELGSFTRHCFFPRRLPTDVEDVADVRNHLLAQPAGISLAGVDCSWTGDSDFVWVAPSDQLAPILDGEAAATKVNDLLGLGLSRGAAPTGHAELVAVHYGSAVDVSARKPTVFNAVRRWRTGYYLSFYALDGWGRTHRCSGVDTCCAACAGTQPCVRERVHRGLPRPPDGSVAFYIGVADPPKGDRKALLADAFTRLMTQLSDNERATHDS